VPLEGRALQLSRGQEAIVQRYQRLLPPVLAPRCAAVDAIMGSRVPEGRWRVAGKGRLRSWRPARARLSRRGALRPQLAVVLGFVALMLLGTLALLLPASSHGGRTDVVTAFFTATSAVCVTGLQVVDTGTYWTPFGQAVLMILMQLGGLGFVVGATVLHLIRRSTLSFQERAAAQEAGYTVQLGGHGGLVQRAVLLALLAEAAGMIILWTRVAPRVGTARGLWFAAFLSVSAFTNGSFDLFGDSRSLADYRTDPVLLLTIAGLIITGGLSLIVVEDVRRARSWRRLALDSKLVLSGTVVLLAAGTLFILVVERGNSSSLAGLRSPTSCSTPSSTRLRRGPPASAPGISLTPTSGHCTFCSASCSLAARPAPWPVGSS
jgi:Trk-type K+ transport system membrane component